MRLTASDVQNEALKYHLELAILQALIDVESGGSGFLPDGRVKILFERHILFKRLQIPGRGIDPRPLAKAHPNLCGRFWNARAYPYGPVSSQWDKVKFVVAWAIKNDSLRSQSYEKAAFESCSYGLFQIMGMNYEAAGFDNVYDFATANSESEQRQLEIALRWMDHNGLIEMLRKQDWTRFVRQFNGPGQVSEYRKKLIIAYQHHLAT